MIAFLYVAVALLGYLLGSIPCGVLISQRFSKTDLRQIGSGKTGMTNVMRAAGKQAAAVALVLDMAKGAVAVILAGVIFGSGPAAAAGALPWMMKSAQVLAALAAIFGHSWSAFLKFKGGRGVATFIGGLLALYWPAAVFGGSIMIIVGIISRYMSLGSITGAVAAFVLLIILLIQKSYPIEFLTYTVYTMICAIFIFLMHWDNIARLVSGTERRLGEKRNTDSVPAPGNQK